MGAAGVDGHAADRILDPGGFTALAVGLRHRATLLVHWVSSLKYHHYPSILYRSIAMPARTAETYGGSLV